MEKKSEKQRKSLRELIKKLPKWLTILITVAAVVIVLVGGWLIGSAVTKSPGQRVFDSYISAAKSGNTSKYVSAFHKKGTDDYDDLLAEYNSGISAYKSFVAEFDKDSPQYEAYVKASVSYENEPMDYGLRMVAEKAFAKSIKKYSVKVLNSDKYYNELEVTVTYKEGTTSAVLPPKFAAALRNGEMSTKYIVTFRKMDGKWQFCGDFSLVTGQKTGSTWASPYEGGGYELRYVNIKDLPPSNDYSISWFNNLLKVNIVSIGYQAFVDCGTMGTKLILTSDVRNIGEAAFMGCDSLEEITVLDLDTLSEVPLNADHKIKIGDSAFRGCAKLRSFTLPSVNKIIPNYLLYGCSSLQSFTIEQGVTSIGHFAFYGCKADAFKEVIIPDSVKMIGDSAFEQCTNLKTVSTVSEDGVANKLNNKITRLGANAFKETAIEQMALPSTLKDVPRGILSRSKLKKVKLPASATVIGAEAFSGTSLDSADLSGITAVGKNAFNGCSALKTVSWGAQPKIKTIGDSAFMNCGSLYELEMPNTIKGLGKAAFASCANLRVVRLNCSPSITLGEGAFESRDSIPKFYVPAGTGNSDGALNTFLRDTSWVRMNLEIYSTRIIDQATNMAIIEENGNKVLIQYLGNEADVDLPDSLGITHIGDGAFSHNTSIENFTFNSSAIKSMGKNVFSGCTNLVYNEFFSSAAGSLRFLEDWLIDCVNVSSYIGNTLDLLDADNLGFRKVVYVDGVMSSVKADLPETVGIAAGAFRSCMNLTTVKLPASVKYIGNEVFMYCSSITTVTLESGSELEGIGKNAFLSCERLTGIELPDTMTSIGDNAFDSCSNLRFAKIASDEVAVGQRAFTPNNDVLKIYVPDLSAGSFFATDEGWAAYSEVLYDLDIIRGGGDYAIDGTTAEGILIQYLGDGSTPVDLSVNIEGYHIKTIAPGAFARSEVRQIVIGADVVSVEKNAFFACEFLYDVEFAAVGGVSALEYIGDFAFQNCKAFEDSTERVPRLEFKADAPNDNFTMGRDVFQSISRLITVSERIPYERREAWSKYSEVIGAKDDPTLHVVVDDGGNDNSANKINVSYRDLTAQYAPDSTVMLNITVDEDYVFDGWFAANAEPDDEPLYTSDRLTLTITEAGLNLVARFSPKVQP